MKENNNKKIQKVKERIKQIFIGLKNKKKKKIVIIALVLFAIILLIVSLRPKTAELNLFEVKKTDLSQEISLTGKVKAAESVSLSFERAGRIFSVNRKSGEEVREGTVIVSLDNSGLEAELAKAEAAVKSAESNLGKVLSGTRPEEISVQNAVVENAKLSLDIAERDLADKLTDSKGKTNEIINNKIDRFFTNPKTDPNLNFNIDDYALETRIESNKRLIEEKISAWNITEGVANQVPAAMETLTAIRDISDKLLLAFENDISTFYSQSTLDKWKTETAEARASVSSSATAITTAREKYVAALNAFAVAEKDLVLKVSGYTSFEKESAYANLESARAAVESVKAEIRRGMIISPISGILGKIGVIKGETVSAGTEVGAVISDKKFQIDAYVPEADIAKIKLGNLAKITLDSYGSDVVFDASIISIDLGETIVDGVTAYKAVIEFANEDERIMSGMTANVDVIGERKAQVIAVPQRAIISNDGRKFLNVLKDKDIVRVEVKTGFKGSDGYVEIINGISEGEKVVVSTPK